MTTSAQRFLHSLFGDAPAGTFLLLWTLQDRRSAWFRADRLGEAAAYAADIGQHGDVYAGCGLRGRDHGEHARGEVAHVVAISGAWCDLDVAKPGATKPYFKTRGDATVFLDDLPIPPTLRMWTGGGYHGWWLFREPWLFGDADDRDRASRCLRAWQAYLRARALEHGATIDATHDLARVLRVPGTINHKYGKPVVLETATGPRCNPGDLEDLVGDILPMEEPAAHRPAGNELHLDPNAAPPEAKLAALLARDLRFRRTWARDRPDLIDQSPSGYDLALATAAARAGWDDPDIIALMIAARRRHGALLKLRADYYERTIARARAWRRPGWRG